VSASPLLESEGVTVSTREGVTVSTREGEVQSSAKHFYGDFHD